MHGRRTNVIAGVVGTAVVASVLAATASFADEPGDDVQHAVATTAVDDSVRAAMAMRVNRAVRTGEASGAAVVERVDRQRARKQLRAERRAERRQRALVRARRALAPQASPVRPGSVRAVGRQMARKHGFGQWWQWNCLDALWTAESGWRTSASNGRTGAYGIPQAYPGSKMASHGADWRHSARTQIAWGLRYIDERWGTPCNAYGHFRRTHWY